VKKLRLAKEESALGRTAAKYSGPRLAESVASSEHEFPLDIGTAPARR
jgi:hypothetical protein